MKSFLSLVAICAVVSLAGCSSTKSSSVAPGAVGEKSAACCADKSACTAEKNSVSPGAVGDKASCTKTCPMTGKSETVSPGAVGESKSGCCASKSSCTGKKIDG